MTGPPAGGGLLGPLFSPSAVAFYGASNDPAKMAGRPFHFLLKHGFEGRAYPINRNRDTVLGRRAYPDLAALPETPEHVFVLLPTEAVETALEECAAAGVRVATVFAGGYAETGPEGAARQRRLVEIARSSGMRLVGPNCLGMINPPLKLALSAANVLELDRLIPGNITVISQSGSLTGTILSRGRDLEVGFAKLISVGNEADLTLGEIGLACIEDPATELFLLFLETLRERDRIAAFARAAHAAGKPVVVYKLGRSEAGRTATLSHTGALVGPDEAVDAFFAAHGLLRVDLFETLLDIAPLVAGRRPPATSLARRGAGVSVITTTGGGGAMVVDRLGSQGLRLVGPSDETVRRCRAKGISVQRSTMVDLTAAGIRHDIVHDAIDSVLANPDADAVVMVAGSTAQFYPHLAVDPIVDFAGSDKPLAAYIVPPAEDSRRLLIAAGIAAFRSPEAAADAIAALFRWRAPRAAAASADATAAPAALARIRGRADEMQALTVFAGLGIEAAASAIVDPGAAPRIDFGYPVAVKALASELAHKSDAGGVLLDVDGAEALGAAIAELRDNLARRDPGLARASILVQRMESGVAEALVGFVRDAQAGPVVTVGVGGIDAELHDDTAVRLAPVSLAEAREMIDEVRGLTVLSGLRGRPRGDAEALARAVVAMSSLAVAAPGVAEAEINPLIVRREGSGAVAVDGLLRLMEA